MSLQSTPSLALAASRASLPVSSGAPTSHPARPSGAPRSVGVSATSAAASDPTASSKQSGSLLHCKGPLNCGRGCANNAQTTPAPATPCAKQREGVQKCAREKCGLRAACAKLTRQGGGGIGGRSKDPVAFSQPSHDSKTSNVQQANTQQRLKAQDAARSKSQPGGGTGSFGNSETSIAPTMRCLLIARVCLGEVYKALSPMPDARMPPNKPNPVAAKLAYDSGERTHARRTMASLTSMLLGVLLELQIQHVEPFFCSVNPQARRVRQVCMGGDQFHYTSPVLVLAVMAECRTRGGVVDGVEFVVFDRAQALPQFVVTYSHAQHCQCAECHRQPLQ